MGAEYCLLLCYGSENPLYGPLYGAKRGTVRATVRGKAGNLGAPYGGVETARPCPPPPPPTLFQPPTTGLATTLEAPFQSAYGPPTADPA